MIVFASEVGYKKIACYKKVPLLVNMMAIYVKIKPFSISNCENYLC